MGRPIHVLIVEDSEDDTELVLLELQRSGYDPTFERVESAEAMTATLVKQTWDIVISDYVMPRFSALAALALLQETGLDLPFIIVSGAIGEDTAVAAMKAGAHDYLMKGNLARLVPAIERELREADVRQKRKQAEEMLATKMAIERQDLLSQVKDLRTQLKNRGTLREVMGSSQTIQEIFEQIQQVASSNFTVIIEGETGTGKEIVARAIHQQSGRSEGPFIALDCGAIPETLIESELFGYEKGAFTGADRRKEGHVQLAEKGTLFLDEIANLPLTTQSKLLRMLQERQVQPLGAMKAIPVDLRIIAASNVTLEGEVKGGRFRQDLFHRLNEFTIRIPPLRERKDDILHLAKRFLDETNLELKKNVRGFSEEAVASLLTHPWPGNARELRNVVRRATLVSQDVIRPEHVSGIGPRGDALPSLSSWELDIPDGLSLKEVSRRAAAKMEKEVIQWALGMTKGNKSRAARLLKIDNKTLYHKLKEHGVQTREFLP